MTERHPERPTTRVTTILAAAYLPAVVASWFVEHLHQCVDTRFDCHAGSHIGVLVAAWGAAHLAAAVALSLRREPVPFQVFTGIFFATAFYNTIAFSGFSGAATAGLLAWLVYPACIVYGFSSGFRGHA